MLCTTGIVLFTQTVRDAQAFSVALWEWWEKWVALSASQRSFPNLLNCTATI
jgi:hypothetical protein